MHPPSIGNDKGDPPQKPRPSVYPGLVPVVLSLVLVIGLWGFPPAFGVYEPHFLLPIFNTILFLAAAVIAYIAWCSYLLSGSATILWLGCGVLALGTGSLAAGWLIYPFGPNVNVTIFNVAVLLAAICHTGSVIAGLDGEAGSMDPERRPRRVAMAYLAVVAIIAWLAGLTLGGVMPPFFIQGQGPTMLRQYVVEWSIVLLTFTSLVLMRRFRGRRSVFLYWYSLALALMAIAMLAFFLQTAVGSLIGWVGRSSYVLAAIYFLVAVRTARRQVRSTGVGLSEAMADLFGPEQSRALFDNLNDSLAIDELIFDDRGKPCDWRILNVNPAYLKATGRSIDEIAGRRLSEIFGIDRAPEPFISRFAQVVQTGKPVQVEGYFEPLRKHLLISAFHLGGLRFATLVTDITERQQAEAALRESEARLELALRSSEMGVWSLDLVENKRSFDDQVCHLLGLDPAKFTGKAEEFFNAVHPQDREAVKSALARSIEHGAPYESEYRTTWPDGSIHHITARGKLVYDNDGRPVRLNGLIWDTTERKQAEEALRLSEEKFAVAFANNPAAIALTRFEDGLIMEVNDTYLTMFGYSRDEVIGRSTLNLNIWPPTGDRARQGKELREKGSFRGREQTLLRRSREPFVALGSVALLKFAGEELVVSTWLDISERKRAEEAMRASEEKYRNLFENMTEEVHFWQLLRDEAGHIITWRLVDANPPTLKTWGRETIQEIRGKTADEIFGPGSTDHFLPIVQKIMAEGRPHAFEDYFSQLDKYFRFTSVPLGDHFITTGADITNIRKAEVARRESEERLRLLGDNLPDSAVYQYVHESDGKVRFLYMSGGIERLNGVSAQEVLQDSGALHRQILPEYYGPLVEAEKQSARELSDFEVEVPMQRSDGEVRWMRLHSRPRRLPDGSTVWDGVQIDVTERKRAEAERQKLIEKLQVTQEELQSANEELMVQAEEMRVQREELQQSHVLLEQRVKERTAEVVAANERMKYLTAQVLTAQEQERKRISMDLHDDLGQSLLVLRMQLNAMLRKSPSEPAISQGLGESAGYLRKIIDKVRNLSHALSPATLGKLNLTEAVHSLLEEFQTYSDIRTEADLDEVGPSLSKEARIGIYRILQEFLTNVQKHAQASKVKVAIKAVDDRVAVSMEDNGIGFDLDEVRGTIHKPGGLGLLSMEGRVQMLGGHLALISQKGQGTRLHFEIPHQAGAEFPEPRW